MVRCLLHSFFVIQTLKAKWNNNTELSSCALLIRQQTAVEIVCLNIKYLKLKCHQYCLMSTKMSTWRVKTCYVLYVLLREEGWETENLITATSGLDSQEIPSAKDWDWIGCGAGFQENISGRVSAASAHQFLSLIGSLDYQNPLCKRCLITYHMIRVLQGALLEFLASCMWLRSHCVDTFIYRPFPVNSG